MDMNNSVVVAGVGVGRDIREINGIGKNTIK